MSTMRATRVFSRARSSRRVVLSNLIAGLVHQDGAAGRDLAEPLRVLRATLARVRWNEPSSTLK